MSKQTESKDMVAPVPTPTLPLSDVIGWLRLATDMLEYPNDYAKPDAKMISEMRAAILRAEADKRICEIRNLMISKP